MKVFRGTGIQAPRDFFNPPTIIGIALADVPGAKVLEVAPAFLRWARPEIHAPVDHGHEGCRV